MLELFLITESDSLCFADLIKRDVLRVVVFVVVLHIAYAISTLSLAINNPASRAEKGVLFMCMRLYVCVCICVYAIRHTML